MAALYRTRPAVEQLHRAGCASPSTFIGPHVKNLIPRHNVYNYGRMQEVWLDRSRAVFGSGPTARRTGDTAGAGGRGPVTTADSVPVTRGAVPTPGPRGLCLARREGLTGPLPPAPAASPARAPRAGSRMGAR